MREQKQPEIDLKFFPRQYEAFTSHATELLFGGASEGGKSVMMRLAFTIWAGMIPGLQCFILRKYYNDVITNHMEGKLGFRSLLRPLQDAGIVRITENKVRWVKTGSLITLAQNRTEEDFEKNQGIEKHVLGIDEATQFKQKHIAGLRGWVRMSDDMKALLPQQIGCLYPDLTPQQIMNLFPRILYTANPIGESVGYFRRNFVLPSPPFEVWRAADNEGGFLRAYIPSRIEDNIGADKEAQRRRLSGMGEQIAAALIDGRWDSPIGDFFKEYNDDIHAVAQFQPPDHWFKYITFDWGSTDPFAVLWWCVSDGEIFEDHSGNQRWFPRGALIAYREWYGCDEQDHSKGVSMRNKDIAKGILDRTYESTSGYVITDSFPFADRGGSDSKGNQSSIATVFADNGVKLTRGNTKRVFGWSQMRARLQGVEGIPSIYFTYDCKFAREYIPALPYHPTVSNDAAESGESTHICDIVRLACTTHPVVLDKNIPIENITKRDNMSIGVKDALTQIKEQTEESYGRR